MLLFLKQKKISRILSFNYNFLNRADNGLELAIFIISAGKKELFIGSFIEE